MAHTHNLVFGDAVLVKTYTSWGRGEHLREWSVLRHVHRHAPDLVPEPLAASLDSDPPSVTMTIVPGTELGGVLTPDQLGALATAIGSLWAVPSDDPAVIDGWRDDLGFARRLTHGPRPVSGVTAVAFDAAVAWWDGPDPVLLAARPERTVLGHRDPNLANYLIDGEQVRIVDLEDARVSDVAAELAILVEHLSARDLDADAFCARFDADPARLRAARRLWAMFWLRLLLPGGPSADRNPPGAADAQARRLLALLGA